MLVKTFGALHYYLWKKPRPSASAFSTAKHVELLGLYPIRCAAVISATACHARLGLQSCSGYTSLNQELYIIVIGSMELNNIIYKSKMLQDMIKNN